MLDVPCRAAGGYSIVPPKFEMVQRGGERAGLEAVLVLEVRERELASRERAILVLAEGRGEEVVDYQVKRLFNGDSIGTVERAILLISKKLHSTGNKARWWE